MTIRVLFQLYGLQKRVFRLFAIPKTMLNWLLIGLLKYEQHLEQVGTVPSNLSRMSFSALQFCRDNNIEFSSRVFHVGLALEGRHHVEGTPPFIDRFHNNCEYSAKYSLPQTRS